MSSLFDTDNWDKPLPRVTVPLPWIGSACVWGPAQTQGSKRAFIHPHLRRPNGKPAIMIVDDNDKALKSWRQEIIEAMIRHQPPKPLDCPVAVNILLYVVRPRSQYGASGELKASAPKLPASGRDIDKVARAILDAGQIARWWVNDARVVDLTMRRRYDDGIGERSWVWAWAVDRPDQPMPELDETIDLGEESK